MGEYNRPYRDNLILLGQQLLRIEPVFSLQYDRSIKQPDSFLTERTRGGWSILTMLTSKASIRETLPEYMTSDIH